MSEKSLWKTLNRKMKGKWVAQRIESLTSPGIPDVYYTLAGNAGSGWIELKYGSLHHYTPEQKNWSRAHRAFGAAVWLLLQNGRDYFFYKDVDDGPIATWSGQINVDELFDILSKGGVYVPRLS